MLRELQNLVPRVGKTEIQSTSVLQKLQSLFPDWVLVTAIAYRGTDRTMGPPQHLSKDMAPYRKTLMILRPSGEIKYEREWEKWDTLSNRQLIRPAHPCRLNVTVFARDSQPSETEAAQPSQVHPSSSEFGQANGFGLQFIQSPCHENQLLLMHKNLGHPSNEQLSKALQANGQRPEMVRAALELKCPVCAASSAPKHQRPSTLKPLLDFNYRIYLDGIQ